MSIMSTIIKSKLNLQTRVFTDEEIRRIDTEHLAVYAYEINKHLRTKYSSEELFTTHWAEERRRHCLAEGDPTAPLDPRVRQEWDRSPALRSEFGEDFQVYAAYWRAERRGAVRRLKGRTA